MSRAFWMAVGAVGGIVAYRKGTRAIDQARELGPLGTARAAAAGTSRIAGRTAHGLSRLEEIRDRRAGRLVTGSVVAEDRSLTDGPVSRAAVDAVPAGWVPAAPAAGAGPGSSPRSTQPRSPGAPSVVVLADGDTVTAQGDTAEAGAAAASRPQAGRTASASGSATPRTTRPRRG